MTPKERRVVDAIKDLTVRGVPPSLQEIADHLKIGSKGEVHRIVHSLADEGVLIIERQKRGIRIPGPPAHIVTAIAAAVQDVLHRESAGKFTPSVSGLEQVISSAWVDAR